MIMLKNKPKRFNENWKKLSFEEKYCYERKVIKNIFWKEVEVTEKRTKEWVKNLMWFNDNYIKNLQKFAK